MKRNYILGILISLFSLFMLGNVFSVDLGVVQGDASLFARPNELVLGYTIRNITENVTCQLNLTSSASFGSYTPNNRTYVNGSANSAGNFTVYNLTAGSYNYEVYCQNSSSDVVARNSTSFNVTIANSAPVISFNTGSSPKTVNVIQGETNEVLIDFSDRDMDSLTFSDTSSSDYTTTFTSVDLDTVKLTISAGAYAAEETITIRANDGTDDSNALTINTKIFTSAVTLNMDELNVVENSVRGTYSSLDFSLNNNAAEEKEVNVTVSLDTYDYEIEYVGTNYQELTNFPVPASSSRDLKLKVKIPQDETFGEKVIGSMYVIESDSRTTEYPILLTTKSPLKVDIEYDGEEDDGNIDDGDTLTVVPGDNVKVTLDLENTYDEDLDIDIENIEIEYEIRDIDDGDDLEGDLSFSDLGSEEEDSNSFTFEVPYRVEENSYDMYLYITAEDENKNDIELNYHFIVEVEKENDFAIINSFKFDRESVSCLRYANLDLEVLNIGSNDIDDWKIWVQSDKLDLDISRTFDLKEYENDEDDDEYRYSVSVDLEDLKAGTYYATVDLYDEDEDRFDTETAYIEIEKCVQDEDEDTTDDETSDEQDDGIDVVIGDSQNDSEDNETDSEQGDDTQTGSGSGPIIVDAGSGNSTSTTFVVLLAVLNVVLVTVVVLLLKK